MALMGAYGFLPYTFDHAIFADTQAEPASVYAWLETLKQMIAEGPHPFPVHTVTAGSLTDDMLKLRTSRLSGQKYIRALIPAYFVSPKRPKGVGLLTELEERATGRGKLGRKCTAEYKVRALLRLQKKLSRVPRFKKGANVPVYCETSIGISLDEAHRMKPSREPWARNVWPLIDMNYTRQDCLEWMELLGFPKPPRSACVYCPFHSDAEWRRLRDEEPEEFKRAVEVDYKLRELARQATGTAKLAGDVFLHSTLKPLDQVEFGDVPDHAQVSRFVNECEALCGV